ncbi:hypothetical protein GUITHDRAFT_152399 [Guillardia theta CCMP2712]|uniref:TOG domain-containing protein n=2 Tax=Guillardia theta TaxID=55529 RepID=L1JDF0_GUITC|nr:hypothetical protein GUITHDRAFT_152399 [Guillardia theta CCMP2712]EKX46546.1 hypothetical protein GUITHDRAFT_152399 [Guillardia theta CCMP2712]|eukprot:XP_005833526.1 hypothetical protein GUITHDRAFT_152399 [Guillardia theta CCMP2712]
MRSPQVRASIRDEIAGAVQKLISASCSDENAIRLARDTLRSVGKRDEQHNSILIDQLLKLLQRHAGEWIKVLPLLEIIPYVSRAGDLRLAPGALRFLTHDEWMVRKAAARALEFLIKEHKGGGRVRTSSPRHSPMGEQRSIYEPRNSKFHDLGEDLEVVIEETRPMTGFSRSSDIPDRFITSSSGRDEHGSAADSSQTDDAALRDEGYVEIRDGIVEAMRSEAPAIRADAMEVLGRCMSMGDAIAMSELFKHVKDVDPTCRARAIAAIAANSVRGAPVPVSHVVEALSDGDAEVRKEALNALDAVVVKGDEEVLEKLIMMKEYSKRWARDKGRPDWEIRLVACHALGMTSTINSNEAIETLKKSLGDEKVEVRRAASYALGLIAEKTAPKGTIWTYNNATAQPGKVSTWRSEKWDVGLQRYIPEMSRTPLDSKMRHSPREILQMLTRTPRGGTVPHLLLTPRNEHLYEGEDVLKALQLREAFRQDQEKKEEVMAIAQELKKAIETHDQATVERLQARLEEIAAGDEEEDEDDLVDDDTSQDLSRTHSLMSRTRSFSSEFI